MKTAIWWIRRDLRVEDNQALEAALGAAERVVPLFVLDDALWKSSYMSQVRLAFMLDGLRALEKELKQRGSRLVLRLGEVVAELADVVRETGAEAVFAEADVSPYAAARDERVQEILPLRLIEGVMVLPPSRVLKANGDPYTVYTPFRRAWSREPRPSESDLCRAPERLPRPPSVSTVPIPEMPKRDTGLFTAGSEAALAALRKFMDRRKKSGTVFSYGDHRNRMDLDGTSGLSPYLRFGMISARTVYLAASKAAAKAKGRDEKASADTWMSELIWREFYMSILSHFPNVRTQSFRSKLRKIRWRNDEREFAAWCEGRTGYPVVDAAMRQLNTTGWMHNRARMIVASFLSKHLLIDWRWGERYFMQKLIDGDPAANNGGWQWSAGTGTDAAPYFRVFNPILQGERFDPDGSYVRRFVPELEGVSSQSIHQPWTLPPMLLVSYGCRLGQDYPKPIVSHVQARSRALAAYRFAQNS